jgi:hypothetical protein
MDTLIAMRKEHLRMQAMAMESADLSSPTAMAQQSQTLASIAVPDQLVPESRDSMLAMASRLAGSASTTGAVLQPSTGSVLLGAVGAAVFASIQNAQIAAAHSSRRLTVVAQEAYRRSDRFLSTSNVSSTQVDAMLASQHMSSILQSMSTSLMQGAVSGEEPVVVNSALAGVTLVRVGGDGGTSGGVLGSRGASIVLPATSGDTMDIRAVSWTNDPVSP